MPSGAVRRLCAGRSSRPARMASRGQCMEAPRWTGPLGMRWTTSMDGLPSIPASEQGDAAAFGAQVDGNACGLWRGRDPIQLQRPASSLRRNASAGRRLRDEWPEVQRERGWRGRGWLPRSRLGRWAVGERALGVEGGEQVAQLVVGERLFKGMLYLVSEARTRSRGNMVEPLTTVAGLMPLTRTRGARPTASSRTRCESAALLTS
jgi:hypothetical protein